MSRVSLGGQRRLWRATSWLTIGLLSLGFPGSSVAFAAGRTEPAATTSGLAVASDPAGATVYVDGQLQGSTPLSLGHLLPGDHRVRVAKGGYLDNSRVVSLQPGSTEAVHVRMTPAVREARALTQVEPEEKKGGGGKKALLIGLGVAAVGVGVILALPKNKPPVAAFNIDAGDTALAGATAVSFDGSGSSDPDGDTLTFNWNFGDGGTGSGQRTTHVYNTDGTFNVVLTVSDGKKSATATGSVTARSLNGNWAATFGPGFAASVFVFNQSGSTLTGQRRFPSGAAVTLTGTLSPPRNVSVSSPGNLAIGFCPFEMTTIVNSTVTQMTGTIRGTGVCTGIVTSATLNRQ